MLTVVKIGGSVLRGHDSYALVATFLRSRLEANRAERLAVIVSAQYGVTDALEAEANAIAGDPHPALRDLLWSTGETRSVALLALHLQRLGVHAPALNIHQAGLALPDDAGGRVVAVDPSYVQAAVSDSRIVILPGFLGVRPDARIGSLGRGGSDLTAVLVAEAVGADACELVKDVPGYFVADPRTRPEATHLETVSYARALEMAADGCDLVQVAALEAARRCALRLVVRSLDAHAPLTHVSSTRSSNGVRHENDSRRPAVRA